MEPFDRLYHGTEKSDTAGITSTRDAILVTIQCERCGEAIDVRLRKSSDLQRDYDGNPDYAFFVNKTIMGNNCFNRMELRLELDPQYQVVSKQLKGGKFVTAE